jgi:hypothetical protein
LNRLSEDHQEAMMTPAILAFLAMPFGVPTAAQSIATTAAAQTPTEVSAPYGPNDSRNAAVKAHYGDWGPEGCPAVRLFADRDPDLRVTLYRRNYHDDRRSIGTGEIVEGYCGAKRMYRLLLDGEREYYSDCEGVVGTRRHDDKRKVTIYDYRLPAQGYRLVGEAPDPTNTSSQSWSRLTRLKDSPRSGAGLLPKNDTRETAHARSVLTAATKVKFQPLTIWRTYLYTARLPDGVPEREPFPKK